MAEQQQQGGGGSGGDGDDHDHEHLTDNNNNHIVIMSPSLSNFATLLTNNVSNNNTLAAYGTMIQPPIHVLLLDLDKESLLATAKMLELCSYEVTKVDDISSAMKMLSTGTKQFDLIMADIQPTGMSGFQLFVEATKMNQPVVLTSAKEETILANLAIENGALLCVQKSTTFHVVRYLWQLVLKERKRGKDHGICRECKRKMDGTTVVMDDNVEGEENNDDEVNIQKMTGKRKERMEGSNEVKIIADPNPSSDLTKRKVCTEWTKELHDKFMDAVHKLGEGKCYPKDILELMNVPGLTRMQVASHLQKCRHDNWRNPEDRKSKSRSSDSENKERERTRNFGLMPRTGNDPMPQKKRQTRQPPKIILVPSGNENSPPAIETGEISGQIQVCQNVEQVQTVEMLNQQDSTAQNVEQVQTVEMLDQQDTNAQSVQVQIVEILDEEDTVQNVEQVQTVEMLDQHDIVQVQTVEILDKEDATQNVEKVQTIEILDQEDAAQNIEQVQTIEILDQENIAQNVEQLQPVIAQTIEIFDQEDAAQNVDQLQSVIDQTIEIFNREDASQNIEQVQTLEMWDIAQNIEQVQKILDELDTAQEQVQNMEMLNQEVVNQNVEQLQTMEMNVEQVQDMEMWNQEGSAQNVEQLQTMEMNVEQVQAMEMLNQEDAAQNVEQLQTMEMNMEQVQSMEMLNKEEDAAQNVEQLQNMEMNVEQVQAMEMLNQEDAAPNVEHLQTMGMLNQQDTSYPICQNDVLHGVGDEILVPTPMPETTTTIDMVSSFFCASNVSVFGSIDPTAMESHISSLHPQPESDFFFFETSEELMDCLFRESGMDIDNQTQSQPVSYAIDEVNAEFANGINTGTTWQPDLMIGIVDGTTSQPDLMTGNVDGTIWQPDWMTGNVDGTICQPDSMTGNVEGASGNAPP